MRTRSAIVVLAAAASCGAGGRQQHALGALTEGLAPFPAEIEAACELAASRCTRCHTIDRVLLARVESPQHWHLYVERMRRQPGSGFSEAEGHTITRCLVHRSFEAVTLP